jgi:hypothetical protein
LIVGMAAPGFCLSAGLGGAAGLFGGGAGGLAAWRRPGAPAGLREVNTFVQCGHFTGPPTSFSGRRNGLRQASQLIVTMPGTSVVAAGVPAFRAVNVAEQSGHLIDLPSKLSCSVSGFLQASQVTTVVLGFGGGAGGTGLDAAGVGLGAAGGAVTVGAVALALVGVATTAGAGGFPGGAAGVNTAAHSGHFTALPSRDTARVRGRLQPWQATVTVPTAGAAAGFGADAAG